VHASDVAFELASHVSDVVGDGGKASFHAVVEFVDFRVERGEALCICVAMSSSVVFFAICWNRIMRRWGRKKAGSARTDYG